MENMQTGPEAKVVIVRQRFSRLAIASFILGILSIVLFFWGGKSFFLSLLLLMDGCALVGGLALTFGVIALWKMRRGGGRLVEKGMALFGVALGAIFMTLFWVLIPHYEKVADEVTGLFIRYLKTQDYENAYEIMTDEHKETHSFGDFRRYVRWAEEKSGRFRYKYDFPPRFHISLYHRRITMSVEYMYKCEKADALTRFRVVKSGKEWKISELTIGVVGANVKKNSSADELLPVSFLRVLRHCRSLYSKDSEIVPF